MDKPPTANQIDKACQKGFFVFVHNRQGIAGAVEQGKNMLPVKGHAWVNYSKSRMWECIPLSSITITSELMKGTNMPTDNVRSITHKRTGKRAHGRPGLPSRKDDVQATGNGKDHSEEKKPAAIEAAPSEKPKRNTTVTVSRSSAKQGELPGVQTSKRKVQEIETLAEQLEEAKDAKKAADDKFKDCEENLIASMKRHDRTFYSRTTWGSVTLKEAKEKATFKREKQKVKE